MRGTAVLAAAALLLGACTSNPIPEGYTGPVAYINDSVTVHGRTVGDFFYVSKVDGKSIDESLSATGRANYGQGMVMTPAIIGRPVVAGPATFTIVGRTHYAAPILELTHATYQVSGDIAFAPEPNGSYTVKGVLGPDYSGVWIVDAQGIIVSDKVEVKGSAKLGFFEK